jgi:hypothetical protein
MGLVTWWLGQALATVKAGVNASSENLDAKQSYFSTA